MVDGGAVVVGGTVVEGGAVVVVTASVVVTISVGGVVSSDESPPPKHPAAMTQITADRAMENLENFMDCVFPQEVYVAPKDCRHKFMA